METMDLRDLSNSVIVVKSTITPEEEEYPHTMQMIYVFYLGT